MALVKTRYEHIVLNGDKEPAIKGTRMKVTELILDRIAYGWSPEELQFQHPELTLSQIYSALAYYSDHQEKLNLVIETQLKELDRIRDSAAPSSLCKRLKPTRFCNDSPALYGPPGSSRNYNS